MVAGISLSTEKTRGRPRKLIDVDLLSAAATEFLAHGYEAASLDTIAAAAGSTKPALYRRYAGKEALFEAVLRHLASEFEIDLSYLEARSEEHTSELQSRENLVCRLLLEKKK